MIYCQILFCPCCLPLGAWPRSYFPADLDMEFPFTPGPSCGSTAQRNRSTVGSVCALPTEVLQALAAVITHNYLYGIIVDNVKRI